MTEATQNETVNDDTTQGETESSNPRESKVFNALKEQIIAERKAREEIEAKFREMQQDEEQRRKEREQAELEAKGNYEEALARLKAETDAERRRYAEEIKTRDIREQMLKAGCNDDIVIRGAVAGYVEGEISDYVAALKEKNAHLFAEPQMPGATAPAQGSSSGARGRPSWETVKQWETSGSREERQRARELLSEYHRENGEYPYKL